MTGQELIDWLLGECRYRKVPPTDSAMILLLREQVDIESAVKYIRHESTCPTCGGDRDYPQLVRRFNTDFGGACDECTNDFHQGVSA